MPEARAAILPRSPAPVSAYRGPALPLSPQSDLAACAADCREAELPEPAIVHPQRGRISLQLPDPSGGRKEAGCDRAAAQLGQERRLVLHQPACWGKSTPGRRSLLCSGRAVLRNRDVLRALCTPALRAGLSWKGRHLHPCSFTSLPHMFKYHDHIITAQLIRRISS